MTPTEYNNFIGFIKTMNSTVKDKSPKPDKVEKLYLKLVSMVQKARQDIKSGNYKEYTLEELLQLINAA